MEKRREQFKRYLDDKKVMDQLSKIVVSLYERPDRPVDPLIYIQDYFSLDKGDLDMPTIRADNIKLAKRLEELKAKLAALEKKQAATKSAQQTQRAEEGAEAA
ncbi:hypothetical protein TRFO_16100 [Tritrichomonas foetus]|uniref:c-Myc-binding protein n=1 Tax=Tritrichomonas foetus TaxID=1144522 RepID=A0A1J4KVE4_9EUKA|nr:hypothetical protein TRFO_16100 [Tritrichomonas foetus]|eukprot:OHT13670.1 hypothetical protein TRFO_16100 [Tritrichomonas foetus]